MYWWPRGLDADKLLCSQFHASHWAKTRVSGIPGSNVQSRFDACAVVQSLKLRNMFFCMTSIEHPRRILQFWFVLYIRLSKTGIPISLQFAFVFGKHHCSACYCTCWYIDILLCWALSPRTLCSEGRSDVAASCAPVPNWGISGHQRSNVHLHASGRRDCVHDNHALLSFRRSQEHGRRRVGRIRNRYARNRFGGWSLDGSEQTLVLIQCSLVSFWAHWAGSCECIQFCFVVCCFFSCGITGTWCEFSLG